MTILRKLGYWIGCAMFTLLGIGVLTGFLVSNGWPGFVFLCFIGIAGALVFFCEGGERG